MAISVVLLLVLSLLLAASNNAQTQNCSTYAFSNARTFANCNNLPALNSFLHWNYHQNNHSVDIAYRHTQINSTNWVAWALNPTSTGMIGAQSLVAFVGSDGTVRAYTAPITSYSPSLEEASLSFPVSSPSADFVDDNQIIIYATIELPPGATSFVHVWQHGDVSGGRPRQHPTSGDHLRSVGNINFASAAAAPTATPTPTPAPPTSSTPPPTTNATVSSNLIN